MNAVGLISGSQSGVLIRGCEIPDLFVKVERSFSEIEDDDFDLTMTDCSLNETSFSVAQDISLSQSESDSGWFESEDKNESRLSDMPVSESRTRRKIQNLDFSAWVRRRPDQGSVLHRASPLGHASSTMILQRDVDGNREATSGNVLDDPKADCIVS